MNLYRAQADVSMVAYVHRLGHVTDERTRLGLMWYDPRKFIGDVASDEFTPKTKTARFPFSSPPPSLPSIGFFLLPSQRHNRYCTIAHLCHHAPATATTHCPHSPWPSAPPWAPPRPWTLSTRATDWRCPAPGGKMKKKSKENFRTFLRFMNNFNVSYE
jgi:hypothetical protein